MAIPQFDNGSPNRIVLPKVGGETEKSRRVFSGDQPVDPAPVGALTFDPETFSPILAVAASCDNEERGKRGEVVYTNDGMDRVAFTLNSFDAGANAFPLSISWEVRGSIGCIPGRIGRGILVLTAAGLKGQIAVVSNYLCTQFELWMRVENPAGTASQAEVRVQAVVDRVGGAFSVISDLTLTPLGVVLLASVAK